MSLKYTPVGHRVLIKVHTDEEKTASGIVVAIKTARNMAGAIKGTVMALGETAYKDFTGDPWVKIGDVVMFQRYEGVVIEDGDDLYRVCNDDDVYAIVKETRVAKSDLKDERR